MQQQKKFLCIGTELRCREIKCCAFCVASGSQIWSCGKGTCACVCSTVSPLGNISPVPLWKGGWEKVVVSDVVLVLDYLQIVFSFPSSALCQCALVILTSWLLLSSVGYQSTRLSLHVYSEI